MKLISFALNTRLFSKYIVTACFFLLWCGWPSYSLRAQQQVGVSGTVSDAQNDETLPGVNILVKGTSTGASTDANGQYELEVESLKDTLVFSFVGYKTQQVPINGRTEIDVALQSQAISGQEMVVVGYGTQQKSDVTGSVSSIKVEELNQGVTSTVGQVLVGKSAGVDVVQNSGEPGSGFSINIRGAGSVNASNSPLYVIDGVPITNDRPIKGTGAGIIQSPNSSRSPLSSLNTQDIESIDILKDASATAIYGSRGANGVILIATKGGRSGELEVDYHGYASVQNISHKLDLLEPQEFKKVLNEIIDAGGEREELRIGEIKNNGTNWQNEISNSNALTQSHQLSFSGGTESTTYYLSFNYLDQEGLIKRSEFNRYGARINVKSQVSDNFNVSTRLTTSYVKDNFIPKGTGFNESAGVINTMQQFDPTLPVRNTKGDFTTSPFLSIDNPLAYLYGVDSKSNTHRTFGSVTAKYDFTENLYGKLNIGADYYSEKRESYISRIPKQGRQRGGVGSLQGGKHTDYLFEGTLHYSNNFGGIHVIKGFLGVSYQRFITKTSIAIASGFPVDALGADNLGLGTQSTYDLNNQKAAHRLGSYIGRINYTLNNKYLITATGRLDGSSRFGENNRFAVFPSFALGWKLKEEDFLKDLNMLSSLKLRVSWGETGNQGIGNYPSIQAYKQGRVAIWNDQETTTTIPARLANPDLKWETTKQTNIGLDFGFLEDRITGSIDFYRKETEDMLLELPVPQSTGYTTRLSNVGQIENKGFEFSINTINISNNGFSWSSDLTGSILSNEVKDLGSLPSIILEGGGRKTGNPAIIREGEPLNSFYGWEIKGVWQENDDFSVTNDNVQPGNLKFRDQNSDSTINGKDQVILGNSFPDLSWSLGNTFNYKGLGLFVSIEGVQGISMYNANKVRTYYPRNFRRNRYAKPLLNRWTPENPSNTYPSFLNSFEPGPKPNNSYTVEDASYIKLRTIRLSYTLPKFSSAIRSATVYVTGTNLYTITDYDGFDPAINSRGSAAYRIDLNTYPSARSFIFGIKLGL